MPKVHETTLEINLDALRHNFDFLKSKLQNNSLFLAVVKAFAYGSDAVAVANFLQKSGVDYFAVAYVSEGVDLRKAGITVPILVLHPQLGNLELAIKHALEPSLYSLKMLRAFEKAALDGSKSNYPIHIKFNTGLNRLGFKPEDIGVVVNALINASSLKVKSVFSHLAASEDLNERGFTENQIELYRSLSEKFINHFDYPIIRHLSNTSGVLNYPKAHFDMVRCGIGLYGYGNSRKESVNLRPIASLKSVISQIASVSIGESVGYNCGHICKVDSKIATIPIGHADGIGRHYGHGIGAVSINQQKGYIVGNVCMDMIMVDVTTIGCKEGDEVLIFGSGLSAEGAAEAADSISYELITGISRRITRKFIK